MFRYIIARAVRFPFHGFFPQLTLVGKESGSSEKKHPVGMETDGLRSWNALQRL